MLECDIRMRYPWRGSMRSYQATPRPLAWFNAEPNITMGRARVPQTLHSASLDSFPGQGPMQQHVQQSCALQRKLTALSDHTHLSRISAGRSDLFQRTESLKARVHLTKHNMIPIEVRAWHRGDEELGAVGVGAAVGHGEQPWGGVRDGKPLIFEFSTIYRLATRASARLEVTALRHEPRNHTMKDRALVMQRQALCASALFTSAESAEVLGRFWHATYI